jgi:hypothetical protein
MRTDPRLIDLAGLLTIIGASALVYDLFGPVALAVTDSMTASLYRLWRGHGAAGKGIEEAPESPESPE